MHKRRELWPAAAIGAAAVLWLMTMAAQEKHSLTLVLQANLAQALCDRQGYPLDDFLERAQAIGVGSVAVDSETLADLARRGEVLAFSRQDVEKGRALGILAPGASLQQASLWIKNPQIFESVVLEFSRSLVKTTTSSAAGYRVIEFPLDFAWEGLPIGKNPDLMAGVSRLGLAAMTKEDLALALVLEPTATLGPMLRHAYSRPRALVAWMPNPKLEVERNLDLLRAAASLAKGRGLSLAAPFGSGKNAPWWLGLACVLGSLFAMRCGLRLLPKARGWVKNHVPPASPGLEMSAAFAANAAMAAALGLACRAVLMSGNQPAAGHSAPLLAAFFSLGFLILYAPDLPKLLQRLGDPLTGTALIKITAAALLALTVFNPDLIAGCLGLSAWTRSLTDRLPWWLPWKWREILFGWPCLFEAQRLMLLKWDCPDCDTYEPRPWLLLGLLAPLGTLSSASQPGMPLGTLLNVTGVSVGLGVCLGGLLIAGRRLLPHSKTKKIRPAESTAWDV